MYVEPAEIDLKESSVDDNHGDILVPTSLHTPVPHENDCVVIDNQVAIETQEDNHNSHNNTSNEHDDCVIKNKQFEGSGSSNNEDDSQAAHKDILFPMRDQKSLEEIKQVIY